MKNNKQNFSEIELVAPEVRAMLAEHGFGLKLEVNKLRIEPFAKEGISLLTNYKSFEVRDDDEFTHYPLYKTMQNELPVYSLTPSTDMDELGFAGFLQINQLLMEKIDIEQIIQDQNDFTHHKSYNIMLSAKGFHGAHKHNCLDKNDEVEKTVIALLNTCLKEIRTTGRLVTLIVDITPVEADKELSSYNEVINELRRCCNADMIVLRDEYDHTTGRITLKIPVESLEPISHIDSQNLIQDLNIFYRGRALTRSKEIINDISNNRIPTIEWSSEMVRMFFLANLELKPSVKIQNITVAEGKSQNLDVLIGESNQSHTMIKHKTAKKLAMHGLTLNVEPDTSDDRDALLVSVKLGNDWFDADMYGCKREQAVINKTVDELIDSTIKAIDTDEETITLVFTTDVKKSKAADLIVSIQERVEKNYGFNLSIGSYSFDKTGDLRLSLSLKSLPLFSTILWLTNKNIYMSIKENIESLSGGGVFRAVDITSKLDMLVKNEPYVNWDAMMIHAFMDTILDGLEHVKYRRALGLKVS